jgi:Protein of unknown function (DUF4232)
VPELDEPQARHRFWVTFVAGISIAVVAVLALVVIVAADDSGTSSSPFAARAASSASLSSASPTTASTRPSAIPSSTIDVSGLPACRERDVTITIGPEDIAGPMAAGPVAITNASSHACRLPSLVSVRLFDEHGTDGPRYDAPEDSSGDVALLPGAKREWLLLYAHRGGADGTVEGNNYSQVTIAIPSGSELGHVSVLCGGLHVSTQVDGPPLDERPVDPGEPPTTTPDLTNC